MHNETLSSASQWLEISFDGDLACGDHAVGQIRFMPGSAPIKKPFYRFINEGHLLHILLIYLLYLSVYSVKDYNAQWKSHQEKTLRTPSPSPRS
jgi:hypothetical protein